MSALARSAWALTAVYLLHDRQRPRNAIWRRHVAEVSSSDKQQLRARCMAQGKSDPANDNAEKHLQCVRQALVPSTCITDVPLPCSEVSSEAETGTGTCLNKSSQSSTPVSPPRILYVPSQRRHAQRRGRAGNRGRCLLWFYIQTLSAYSKFHHPIDHQALQWDTFIRQACKLA